MCLVCGCGLKGLLLMLYIFISWWLMKVFSSVLFGVLKWFLLFCQFFVRWCSILKCCLRFLICSVVNFGVFGVVVVINRGGIVFFIKLFWDVWWVFVGGWFFVFFRCDLNLNQWNCFRIVLSSCNIVIMSFRIKIIIFILFICVFFVVKEYNKLMYFFVVCCQFIFVCCWWCLFWLIVCFFYEWFFGLLFVMIGVCSVELCVVVWVSDCMLLM